MIAKAVLWGVRRYIGGPGRSWLFTTLAMLGMRAAKSMTGRRELIDVSDVKPGQRLVIEHLPVSHKKQIKSIKGDKKVAAKSEKAAARDTKARTRSQAKAEKVAAREAKDRAKAEKAAAREAKSRAKAERSASSEGKPSRVRVKAERSNLRTGSARSTDGRRRLRRSRSSAAED